MLDSSFVNIRLFPLARTYLIGKVVGKFCHLPYELVDYRLKTPVYNECVTILEFILHKEGITGVDKSVWLKMHEFWMWYHAKSLIADRSSFHYKINESVMEELKNKERVCLKLLIDYDYNPIITGNENSDEKLNEDPNEKLDDPDFELPERDEKDISGSDIDDNISGSDTS